MVSKNIPPNQTLGELSLRQAKIGEAVCCLSMENCGYLAAILTIGNQCTSLTLKLNNGHNCRTWTKKEHISQHSQSAVENSFESKSYTDDFVLKNKNFTVLSHKIESRENNYLKSYNNSTKNINESITTLYNKNTSMNSSLNNGHRQVTQSTSIPPAGNTSNLLFFYEPNNNKFDSSFLQLFSPEFSFSPIRLTGSSSEVSELCAATAELSSSTKLSSSQTSTVEHSVFHFCYFSVRW